MSITRIEAQYRVVTPMFIAGADPSRPELRAPSFKGGLRFWWRALAWSRFGGDLKRIHPGEQEIFGSAAGRRSRVAIILEHNQPQLCKKDEILRDEEDKVVGQGVRYLGYGILEAYDRTNAGKRAGQLTRACLLPPFQFTAHLRCRALSPSALDLILDALKALGTLGGLGARTRRGFGSCVLERLEWQTSASEQRESWLAPKDIEGLAATIKAWIQGPASPPPYTAFSPESRSVLVEPKPEVHGGPMSLLNLVGREMVRYRSNGRGGTVLGDLPTEGNFAGDKAMLLGAPTGVPRRAGFGLPHNYYFGSSGRKVRVMPIRYDRRASPLFIHIHEWDGEDGPRTAAVLTFLPGTYLPGRVEGKAIRICASEGKKDFPVPSNIFDAVDGFMNRLSDPGTCKEPFGTAMKIP